MRMTRLPLIVTVFMGIMLCAWTAQAAAINAEKQICEKKDFMEFIAAFSELTVQQQAVCARFPLTIGGKTYKTLQAFLRSPAAKYKIIGSKKETEKHGKTATPFFLPLPPDKNLDRFDLALKYAYLIAQDGNNSIATLTEGGTLSFSTVEFVWNGEQWRIIDVRE